MTKIIEASSNIGDIVLDPFNGSGTTIHAANNLERKWIGIDQSFTAAESTLKRMKYGLKQMGDYVDKSKKDKTKSLFEESNIKFNFIVDANVLEQHPNEVHYLASL